MIYNDVLLTFQPSEGDWSFSSASQQGVSLDRSEAIHRLPCLGDALEEVAAKPTYAPDTSEASSVTAPVSPANSTRNAVFLWVVGLILLGIIFFAIRPYTNSVPRHDPSKEKPRTPKRRPSAAGLPAYARKAADPPTSGERRRIHVDSELDPPAEAEDPEGTV